MADLPSENGSSPDPLTIPQRSRAEVGRAVGLLLLVLLVGVGLQVLRLARWLGHRWLRGAVPD